MEEKLCFILPLLMLIAIAVFLCSANAAQNYYLWFDSQCGSTPARGYFQQYQKNDSDKTSTEIRHNVVGNGASAGFTNLLGIYEYGSTGNLLMGSKWCAPNGIYYSFSMRLQKDHLYAPYGRANTRYYNMHGLSTVSIEGQSRVN